MKKLFSKLAAAALTLALFSACEDVPAPYYIIEPGEVDIEIVGSGTKDDPYDATSALNIINSGTYTSDKVYVKGFISQIDDIDTGNYGNATYYISNDGTTENQLEVYRGYSLGGAHFSSDDEIKIGDEIIVYGVITMYNSTPEFTQGSQIYYLNGVIVSSEGTEDPKGEGTKESPYNVSKALKIINDGSYTSDRVFVEGTISTIDDVDTGNFGNATYFISDDGSKNGQLEIYRGLYLGGDKFTSKDQIKVGDKVIVYGQLTLYGTTPEFTQGSQIYKLNDTVDERGIGGGTGVATGSGTMEDPYNAIAANEIASKLPSNGKTDNMVYIKGKVASIKEQFSTQYGNASFYISDDGKTTDFYIFRALYLGNQKWANGDTELKVGDDVIIHAKLTNYQGNTPETVQGECYLYSLNGKTNGNAQPADEGTPKGDGSLENPFNAAAANAAAKALASDAILDNPVYIKGIISNVKEQFSAQYGNATFYISDDGKTTSAQFYCFRVLYLDNRQWTTSDATLKVGDEVVIYGKLTNYRGNTPETLQNEAYLYSLNSNSGGGGNEEPTPALEGGTYDDPFTVADAQQVYDSGTVMKAYVKGYIVGYIDGNSYTTGAKFSVPDAAQTEILIAATADETDPAKCIPVQLPNETNAPGVRAGLELSVHPDFLGKDILLYGSIEKYFNVCGIKSTTYAEVSGQYIIGVKP